MAATHGRLTGKPGVCISTLGPGALNLSTGAAYAHLGAMPMIMLTGQKAIKTAKQAKAIFEKHGAEFLRLSRFHTGMWAGEYLVATRYSSWEAYGKVQEALAKDETFAKLFAHTTTFAELTGRNIAVGIDL